MTSKIDVVEALRGATAMLLRSHPYGYDERRACEAAIPVAEAMAKVVEAADRYYYNRSQKTWSELCEALAALRKAEEG